MLDKVDGSLDDLVRAANRQFGDAQRSRTIGGRAGRFELYHSAGSLGSHHVRMALAEKATAYVSHDISLLPPRPENFHPAYVSLRLKGGSGRDFIENYSGRDGAAQGFDPCGVPTLVDHETGQIIVEARSACDHIDRAGDGGNQLVPVRMKREIDAEIAICETIPHLALLYGANPDQDFRPEKLRRQLNGAHDHNIMKLMEGRSLCVGQLRLTAAYDARIRREAAARHFVSNPALMREALTETLGVIADLEDRLSDGREWICGEAFTLADIYWAAMLARLKWAGLEFAWKGEHALNATERSGVGRYAQRLFQRPSFREAVVDWPGNPLSDAFEGSGTKSSQSSSTPTTGKKGGSGRDIREENLTAAVLDTMKSAPSPRAKKVLSALTRHLHAFLEEVEPTEEEWEYGIEFLTRTGHMCKDGRQEFILLSDVTGATARVDLINHRFPGGATENSVLGPFYFEERPSFDNGADISEGIEGRPMLFNARVVDTSGQPIAGANVDIWHSDDDGHYDVVMPNVDGTALRGLFRSDAVGRFWFMSIVPESYPIPSDGPVGDLLRAAGRPIIRPAHVHVRINAPGFERLTTMLFVAGDEHIDDDPVFGVKSSLVVNFEKKSGVRMPDGKRTPDPCWLVDHEFVLARKK